MDRLQKMLRPQIASLKPYSSARDEYAVGEVSAASLTLLDANENALGSMLGEGLNRYPDPYQINLKREVGGLISVLPEYLFLGQGSDEAIDLLIRAFCEPKEDEILIFPPTYGMYEVSAAVNSVHTLEVPLNESFQLQVDEAKKTWTERTKLVFVCSPNNPTGNTVSREDIISLLESFPGYIVVDEAYIDFCEEKMILPLINQYDNLIVLRTFSKAWGLAGIRLGMAIAAPGVVRVLNSIKPPYNISTLTERAALRGMRFSVQKKKFVQIIIEERKRLSDSLLEARVVEKVYPSDANFILVRFSDGPRVYNTLKERGVIVRDRGSLPGLEHCLRITIGKKKDNDQLISIISAL
jgi:histidinol-phosphate aminotransferase